MLVVLVLVAFAVGPGLSSPDWATALTFALQVLHCLPRTRRLRGWWTLAAQAALFPWAALPGFLSGSVLLIVPDRRLRWALFAAVVLAAGLSTTTSLYDCANAVGNTISQGLVIFALTRLDEVRAELHATRGELAARSVATERAEVSQELEATVGSALAEIIRQAERGDLGRVATLARQAAERVRQDLARPTGAVPTDLTPRMMLPILVVVHLSYLVVATLFVQRSHPPAAWFAGDLLLLTAVVALQLHHSLPRTPPARAALVAWTLPVQVVLACLPLVQPGTPYPQLVGLAAGALLIQLPGRIAWPLCAALLAAVPVVLTTRGVAAFDVLSLSLDTVVMAVIFHGIALTTGLVHEVRETRRELAEIAVARERRRIVRDTHDLLGHGLSAIVIKAGLAVRLPDRAGRDAAEIAGIARRSLADLRAIPGDSVTLSLDRELGSTGDVLAAAGTSLRLTTRHGRLPSRVDGLLATVLREAVTNVLRHSRARLCVIDTDRAGDEVRLRVANDSTVAAEGHRAGRGIGNLAERVRASGGALTTRADEDGFALTVRLPVEPSA
ncbi:sensor histidine kinase [Actinophytocola gossypii]|uniref:Signal transduction histidine kinase subgroup 3 dimerisation and phosphoacceptor domain-containing protein n=1 Tax=Actinophytocola gossypii TaxID=2812003 RepID=A0ABT2J7U2_9PSEU|nr:histidine kinase [Actinophytocola gossypii]MCT2583920.1 hypothetical protein [Actinophytocola gossypii]